MRTAAARLIPIAVGPAAAAVTRPRLLCCPRAAARVYISAAGRLSQARPSSCSVFTPAAAALSSRGMTTTTHVNGSAANAARREPDITAAVGGQRNVDKLHKTSRDFRSDTFTMPTDAQLMASLTASRGDDVYHEDDDTAALEERIARMTGKEACMFGASGTMTNQLAIRTHMQQPPHSIITDHRAHVHMFEAGGIALFSQATTHGIVPSDGVHLSAEDVEGALQLGSNIHIAPTKLVCLENTLSGIVFPQDEVVKIGDLVHSHGIKLHLDGARLWNVAAKEVEARGLDATNEADVTAVVSDLLAPFDSASLCLSKGIGAPIGSAVVGSKEFIERARWFRKAFGGGWRQAGPMAAMADHALTHHFPRLAPTHALARRLADGLEAAGCDIVAPVDTNMVFFDPSPLGLTVTDVVEALARLPDPITLGGNRCVLHHQTSPQAVDDFIAAVKDLAESVPAERRPQKVEGGKLGAKDGKFRINVLRPPSDPVNGPARKKVKLGY